MTHRRKSILLTRRTFAASLIASGALGIGIGEVAAPLAQSQAHAVAVASRAPVACAVFATDVGQAFEVLGAILTDVPTADLPGCAGRRSSQRLEAQRDHGSGQVLDSRDPDAVPTLLGAQGSHPERGEEVPQLTLAA
jgi:hypothetical protein